MELVKTEPDRKTKADILATVPRDVYVWKRRTACTVTVVVYGLRYLLICLIMYEFDYQLFSFPFQNTYIIMLYM